MKKRNDWFPKSRPKQLVLFNNIKAKIDGYEAVLPLSKPQLDRIKLVCDTFIAIYNYVEQTRATTAQLTEWQKIIFDGDAVIPDNEPAPTAPVFATVGLPTGAFVNIFKEFRLLRDQILSANGYNTGIGEDLMLVAPAGGNVNMQELVPDLKVAPLANGYRIRLDGSLKGTDALRVEYQRKGASNWTLVNILTALPAELAITPQTAGEPETGTLRAVFLNKNEEIGQFSPNYPITVS